MTQEELNILIDRYFDADMSVAEERELRAFLATCPWQSQKIDEAKAVMGYATMPMRRQRRRPALRAFQAAAAVAAIVVVAVALWPARTAYGFAGGERIASAQQAVELMHSDLAALAQASAAANADIEASLSLFSNIKYE